ncbi:MAG: hypothetical protein NVSMB29_10610 [Candidatus Dormibacteria bacterium]
MPDPLLGERLEAVERAVAREAELLTALEESRQQTEELFTTLLEAHSRTLERLSRLTATMRGEREPSATNGARSTSAG